MGFAKQQMLDELEDFEAMHARLESEHAFAEKIFEALEFLRGVSKGRGDLLEELMADTLDKFRELADQLDFERQCAYDETEEGYQSCLFVARMQKDD